jgi:inorganic pyrophosphatase
MGFALVGLGMAMLYITMIAFRQHYPNPQQWMYLTESLTGYGLGGSCIAMFGRVGGGIYTKAADVGADLVGKVVHGIPEDDPRNPATIADNVGDNVGDVAGMGSDLFGSFAESTCAALLLGSSLGISASWDAMCFPIIVTASGVLTSLVCSFIATGLWPVKTEKGVERALKVQLTSTMLANLVAVFFMAEIFLPPEASIPSISGTDYVLLTPVSAWGCVSMGAAGGLIIGLITEFYTSHSYGPGKIKCRVAAHAKTTSRNIHQYIFYPA